MTYVARVLSKACLLDVCGLCHRFPVERHWHQSIDGFTLHISILRKLTEVDCEWTIPTAHVRTVFSLFLKRSTDRDSQKLQMMEYDDLQIPYSMYRSNVSAIISFPWWKVLPIIAIFLSSSNCRWFRKWFLPKYWVGCAISVQYDFTCINVSCHEC